MCVTYPRARYLSASNANMPTRSATLPRRTPGIAKGPASTWEAGPSMPLDQQRIISETNSEGDSLDDLGDTIANVPHMRIG